ncbi:hypothetical protein Poly30_03060 [Planctomycetes bacterium Poly30]|uniref:DUF1501 domain-containing protein n=1 Tax=Saltatorellus ferox TaxID=2528018 RepID=A0A518EL42_9BACT|nr:hypothetical protein Poly30_03060 [Planctomycetes bacterium Poly30]
MSASVPHSLRRGSDLTRRHFLRLAGSSAAAAAIGPHASAMRVFSSRENRGPKDYRALVCVFLYGGADSLNLLVPTSPAEYDVYRAARGDLAEAQGSLLPIQPLTPDGATYGVHGACPELQALFQAGRLAFTPNVGPLVRPLTKAQVLTGLAETPRNLFSHNDQQTQWQVAHADGPRTTGWAGRMLDRIANASPAPLSPGISIDVTGQLLVGANVQPYVLGATGSEPLALTDDPGRRAIIDAMMRSRNAIAEEFARTQRESIEIDDLIGQTLLGAPDFAGLFPDSSLGQQLRMVARMISIRAQLGVRRQVFFVGTGGFDTHDDQLALLPLLFRNLSRSIGAFQGAMDQIGEAQNVTGFTHSEFGRTLSSNGQGSDHGWGGHSLAFGGAVRGQDLYGAMPDLSPTGPDDIGEGRLLPGRSVDQFGATLASWFGLAAPEVDLVFPNLGNFASRDLGFMG